MLRLKHYSKYQKQFCKLTKKNKQRYNSILKIVDILISEKPIPSEYNDHPLVGNLSGYYDLHVEPNLILVYTIVDNTLILCSLVNHDDLEKLNLPIPTDIIKTISFRKLNIRPLSGILNILRARKD